MDTDLPSFAKSAKELSRNPLGIIALFIVLVYGFACLLFGFSAGDLESFERQPIIWFVVLFPLAVLALFGWLVSSHHDKLYSPKDYRDDNSFLKTLKQKAIDTSESSKDVTDLLKYGGEFSIVSEQQELIEKQLGQKDLAIEGQTTKILVRQLAASQVIAWFEKTYYDIFGSQIALLQLASLKDKVTDEEISKIFEKVKHENPEALGSWSTEQYLEYLIQSKLIEKVDKGFAITVRGNEFIKILTGSGYSAEKSL
jgi:hypothetical protein